MLPIFTLNHGFPHYVGTGILLNLLDRHFILSAAHVLLDNSNNILIPINGDLVQIDEEIKGTSIPKNKTRNEDRFDVAVLELNNSTSEQIKNENLFLNLNDCLFQPLPESKNIFLLSGFPYTNVGRKSKPNKIVAEPYGYWDTNMQISNTDFINTKTDHRTHILIPYDRKNLFKFETGKVTGKNLEGMSGSGIWCISNSLIDSEMRSSQRKLAGVFIEHHSENLKLLVSTKIEVVFEMMRHFYRFELPENNLSNLIQFESN
ncbi:hypothetical protein LEP1GSC040_1745 [Leptospira santarosai str. 2000030832]|nr:hypothetical protein LEP1GSC040_1745 [Leptospira santarosai str. 2000030832]